MNNETKPLKLVLKCIDKNEHGKLYALNQLISDEKLKEILPYFKNYKLEDYENIMEVEGNPQGWMCSEENVAIVEDILGVDETVSQQEELLKQRQQEANKLRKKKNQAMDEIEQIYAGVERPTKFLKKLLKKAKIVYDPQDIYYNEHTSGEGQLFIIDKDDYIWYIINNSRPDDDHALNNIKTDTKGAVGFRVKYTDHLHDLIKLVSNENIYKGK